MSLFNKKQEKENKKKADGFFTAYTFLCDEWGLELNAILEFSVKGIKPVLTIVARERLSNEKPAGK